MFLTCFFDFFQAEYVGNNSKNGKDIVARQVRDEVEKRGGRFLKKVKKDVVVPGDTSVWIAQAVDVAVLKIKQVCARDLSA